MKKVCILYFSNLVNNKGADQTAQIRRLVSMFAVHILLNFLLPVKAVTLIFIPRRGSAISSAKQGKSGSIYTLVKN